MGVYPCFQLRSHNRKVLNTLKEHEVYYCCTGYAAEKTDFPFESALIFKGENKTGYILHYGAEHKCYCNRKEDAEDNRQGLFGVEQIAHAKGIFGSGNLEESDNESGSQKFKDKRYRC